MAFINFETVTEQMKAYCLAVYIQVISLKIFITASLAVYRGAMDVHQVTWTRVSPNNVSFRRLSHYAYNSDTTCMQTLTSWVSNDKSK
jgi:hypothetical protein